MGLRIPQSAEAASSLHRLRDVHFFASLLRSTAPNAIRRLANSLKMHQPLSLSASLIGPITLFGVSGLVAPVPIFLERIPKQASDGLRC